MLVCSYCLQAIESHIGRQVKTKPCFIVCDFETVVCDWCGEEVEVEEVYKI